MAAWTGFETPEGWICSSSDTYGTAPPVSVKGDAAKRPGLVDWARGEIAAIAGRVLEAACLRCTRCPPSRGQASVRAKGDPKSHVGDVSCEVLAVTALIGAAA